MATKKSVTAAKARAAVKASARKPVKGRADAGKVATTKAARVATPPRRDVHAKAVKAIGPKAKTLMKTDKSQAVKAIAAKVAAAKASGKTAARAPVTKPTLVKAVAKPVVAAKPVAAKAAAPVKAVAPVEIAKPAVVAKAPEIKAVEVVFDKGDFVVYPAHGVGRVVDIEAMKIAGTTIDVFVMSFEQDRMTLRVPVAKAKFSGLRKLSSRKIMDSALTTLKGRGRISRAMWNRRAQEYEAKINSGDPVSIAEVVRDLHRNAGQPDQSYSERQIYEAALDRLAREFAAVERIDKEQATEKLTLVLNAALMKQAA